jgi:hypothetical protein
MQMLIVLVSIGVVMALPILLYVWRLKGNGTETMGMGIGDVKFGKNLGDKRWQEMNEQPEDRRTR